jgi:hypothetical protein
MDDIFQLFDLHGKFGKLGPVHLYQTLQSLLRLILHSPSLTVTRLEFDGQKPYNASVIRLGIFFVTPPNYPLMVFTDIHSGPCRAPCAVETCSSYVGAWRGDSKSRGSNAPAFRLLSLASKVSERGRCVDWHLGLLPTALHSTVFSQPRPVQFWGGNRRCREPRHLLWYSRVFDDAYFSGFSNVQFNLYSGANFVATSSILILSSGGGSGPMFFASGYAGPVDNVGIVGNLEFS